MPSAHQAEAKAAVCVGLTAETEETVTETETERRPRDLTTICRNFDLLHIRCPEGVGANIRLLKRVVGWKRPLALRQKAAVMTPRLSGELQK